MKNLIALSMCFITLSSAAQLRLNVSAGVANYSGDIQQKNFTLNQSNAVASIGFSYELSDKFLLRSDLSFAKIGADDKLINSIQTVTRNLNFKSNITELNLLAEYSPMNIYETGWTPYAFAGIGVYKFNPYTRDSSGNKIFLAPLGTEGQGLTQYPNRTFYKTVQVNLPLGGGIKYALSDDIHVGVELGVRKTFTDYLDDVSTTYVSESVLMQERGPRAVQYAFRGDELKDYNLSYPQEGAQRGGSLYKDFFYFGQVRLNFRLNTNNGYGAASKVGCPNRM